MLLNRDFANGMDQTPLGFCWRAKYNPGFKNPGLVIKPL